MGNGEQKKNKTMLNDRMNIELAAILVITYMTHRTPISDDYYIIAYCESCADFFLLSFFAWVLLFVKRQNKTRKDNRKKKPREKEKKDKQQHCDLFVIERAGRV